MFSRRTQWNLEENRLTLLLRDKRKRRARLLDLTESNPTQCGFPAPDDLLHRLSASQSRSYAPDPKGSPAAREAVAEFYAKQNIDVSPDQIVLTAGTSEAYSHLFQLLCNPGEFVLSPSPCYPLIEDLARLTDISLAPYRLRYDGEWHVDFREINERLNTGPRAVIMIHPHNPTGMLIGTEIYARMETALHGQETSLIADEVFSAYRFADDGRAVKSFAASKTILTFTLNGLSKLAGLPQMKLGWIVVNGPRRQREEALQRLEIICDTFLSVSSPVQHILPDILRNHANFTTPIQTRITDNLQTLRNSVDKTSLVSFLQSDGGWNAVLRLPGSLKDEDWCLRFLEQGNVVTYPGHFFDFEDGEFAVISLLPFPDVFEEGVFHLLDIVSKN